MNYLRDGSKVSVTELIGKNNYIEEFPKCPSGGTYKPGPNDSITYHLHKFVVRMTCESEVGGKHAPYDFAHWDGYQEKTK